MSEKIIYIRDTRNGVTALMKASMLDHPAYSAFFEEVRTDKPVNQELHSKSTPEKDKEPEVVETKSKSAGVNK